MTTEDIPDYYAEFGIDRSASADTVKEKLDRSFRTWSSRASRAPDATKRREAEDKVALIARARKDLLDSPAQRHAYHLRLDQARQRPRTPEPTPGPRTQPHPQTQPHLQPTLGGRDWVGHARSLIDQGNTEGALYELRQAVHYDDGNGDAWRLLGAVHAAQGRWNDALQEFQRALALHPRDALTHTLIAQVHEQLGNPTTAANWHLAAARLAPDDTDMRVTAANSLYQAKRYDEALSNYEQALAQRSGDPAVRDQIGRIWSLRAEGAMVWHPVRQRYVIASESSVSMVTHCVDQALAVGISDPGLTARLNDYRVEADIAPAKTWRWHKSMAVIMGICLMLTWVSTTLTVLAVAGFLLLPIVMGVKPRWQHAYNDLPPHLRPQTRRFS
ncbi:tetratricopeptide repeat protein [Streptomyces sp. NBC_00989]|uniref:tetratricopeptide repeat protein n=1 Tax=Streptomyces sp. NBC_00989 TaxID=2903705 RepID=UPI003863CD98|nr:tetratricopeptide repeat protein [Streptomyces sp. NBC_00989]